MSNVIHRPVQLWYSTWKTIKILCIVHNTTATRLIDKLVNDEVDRVDSGTIPPELVESRLEKAEENSD